MVIATSGGRVEVEALHGQPAGLEAQRSNFLSVSGDEDMYHSDSSRFFGPSRGELEEVCVLDTRCSAAQDVLDRCHLASSEGVGARQRTQTYARAGLTIGLWLALGDSAWARLPSMSWLREANKELGGDSVASCKQGSMIELC